MDAFLSMLCSICAASEHFASAGLGFLIWKKNILRNSRRCWLRSALGYFTQWYKLILLNRDQYGWNGKEQYFEQINEEAKEAQKICWSPSLWRRWWRQAMRRKKTREILCKHWPENCSSDERKKSVEWKWFKRPFSCSKMFSVCVCILHFYHNRLAFSYLFASVTGKRPFLLQPLAICSTVCSSYFSFYIHSMVVDVCPSTHTHTHTSATNITLPLFPQLLIEKL